MIYITSDLHLGHNKDFLYAPRGFSSIEEHDKTIVENYNSIVQDDDDVYILGDVMLNDNESTHELVKSLKGKIHLILGNHDTDRKTALYKTFPNIVDISMGARLKYRKYRFYLTHYPTITDTYGASVSLETSVINLCGHSHTTDAFTDWYKGLIYHCELDAHHNKPVLLDDIIEDCKKEYYAARNNERNDY